MKKFLFRILIFIVPIVPFAYIADYAVTSSLKRSRSGNFAVWNDIFDGNVNSDIYIYGSSRAWVHINPKIIEDSLGTQAYNFGVDGHNFYMQYLRHKLLLKYNDTPKLIIVSLDNVTLDKRQDLFEPEQFAPYLSDPDVAAAIKTYRGFDLLDYRLPFLRYVGLRRSTDPTAGGFFFTRQSFVRYKGFEGQARTWNADFDAAVERLKSYVQGMDSGTVQLFDQFLKETKAAGINLMFVYSPEYIEGQKFVSNRAEIFTYFRKFSKEHAIPFFDYSTDSICYNQHYFYNSQHLNAEGADLFTKKLVAQIKALYNR